VSSELTFENLFLIGFTAADLARDKAHAAVAALLDEAASSSSS